MKKARIVDRALKNEVEYTDNIIELLYSRTFLIQTDNAGILCR
ncbi:MAG: hypothetical protein WD317_07190 [Balneolaceae bacterium]